MKHTTTEDEVEKWLDPELKPLLTLQLREGWTRKILRTGTERLGMGFYYREGENDRLSVWISYWGWSDYQMKYETWLCGSTDKPYKTLEEAVDRAQYLMPLVERQFHWEDIVSVRNEEYCCNLIDRNGIGGATIMALLDRFITLDSLREASLEEIAATPGIGPDKAWLIAGHLHPNVRYHELWDPAKGAWVSLYRVPEAVIDEHLRTYSYMTQKTRNKYRLARKEIRARRLTKVKGGNT